MSLRTRFGLLAMLVLAAGFALPHAAVVAEAGPVGPPGTAAGVAAAAGTAAAPAALASAVAAQATAASPGEAAAADAPVETPRSVRLDLRSAAGGEYRIMVAQPLQPPPPTGYPVIYVLDGNSAFGTVADAVRVQSRFPAATGIDPALVVAIGYPTEQPFDPERRVHDLSVHTPASMFPPRPDGQPRSETATGGADAFLEFIVGTVKPAVEARYPVDRQRQTLMGHSLGGLFTLHALFARPGEFRHYLALSPSVWWKQRYILEAARGFAQARKQDDPPVGLFVATGEREQDESDPPEIRMIDNARALVEGLQPLAERSVRAEFHLVPGEHHRSVLPSVLSRALRTTAHAGRAAAPEGFAKRSVEYRARSNGRRYEVQVFTPGDATLAIVPRVIYALDTGPTVWAALKAARAGDEPTAVVAVPDGSGSGYDLTPAVPAAGAEARGGADAFLHFLVDELVPALEAPRRRAPDRVLTGWDRAAWFALYGLINAPATFDGYVAAAPPTAWQDGFLLNGNLIGRIGPKLETGRHAARVVLQLPAPRSETDARLLERLQATSGVVVRAENGGEDAYERAIATAFALRGEAVPPSPPRTLKRVAGIPIPTAEEYLRWTPQKRYDVRIRVRALPAAQRDAWGDQFKYNLDAGLWYADHRALHDERVRMDELHGTAPPDE